MSKGGIFSPLVNQERMQVMASLSRRKPVKSGVTRDGTKPSSISFSLSIDVPGDIVVKVIVTLFVLYRLLS